MTACWYDCSIAFYNRNFGDKLEKSYMAAVEVHLIFDLFIVCWSENSGSSYTVGWAWVGTTNGGTRAKFDCQHHPQH